MASLGDRYQSAVGQTFFGKVVRQHTINEKEWTVIEIIGAADGLEHILSDIYREVGEDQVWRGFTGPPSYNSYRLWVDLSIDVGVTREFTVTGYEGPFYVSSGDYQGHKGYCFTVE